MNAHDPHHESLLMSLLVGDLTKDAPEMVELLSSCADCRTRLEELEGVARSLDAVAEQERRDLAAAREVGDAPGLADVDRILRDRALQDQAGADPSRARRPLSLEARRHRLARPLAAAIVVLCLAAAVFIVGELGSDSNNPDPEDRILGTDGLVDLSPAGTVSEILEFSWTGTRPAGGSFTVRIFAADSDLDAEPIMVEGWIRGTSWTPTVEIPWREFDWNVVSLSAMGEELEHSERVQVRRAEAN